MKAVVTFEDGDDQVLVGIDFGEEGGTETSPAHQMAAMAMHLITQQMAKQMPTKGPVQ